MSICKECFHSYVCEQFNEHREQDNEKCRFANDHFVSADLINRQKAENEKLAKDWSDVTIEKDELFDIAEKQKAEIERLAESLDKTIYKLEYLLCYATGSKLSKHTYELKTMYGSVNDYIQKCCEEAKAEAIKEFAEKVDEIVTKTYNKHIFGSYDLTDEEKDAVINFSDDVVSEIADLVKEMVGDGGEQNDISN